MQLIGIIHVSEEVSHLGSVWLGEWIWEDGFEGIWVDCVRMKRLFGLRDGW